MFDFLDPFFDGFTLLMLLALLVGGVFLILWLAALPGNIARARKHPYADAVSVCGWMGLVTGVLWPVALVWAYATPDNAPNTPPA